MLVADIRHQAGIRLELFNLSHGSSVELLNRTLTAFIAHEGWQLCYEQATGPDEFFGASCPIRRNYELIKGSLVRKRLSDLLELCDNFHDLENFYEHQKPTWEKLRKASDRFQLNRLELDRDTEAAPALKRMQEILQAPSPYGIIKDAEGLITKVESINTALVSQRRTEALGKIDATIAEVSKELTAAQADTGLRSGCLAPLETLRKQVEQQASVAHVTQAEQEAVRTLDIALAKIEEAAKKKQAEPQPRPQVGDPPAILVPAVKPRCVVKPADLASKPYLETDDDVDAFLAELKTKLKEAIALGQRIKIQ